MTCIRMCVQRIMSRVWNGFGGESPDKTFQPPQGLICTRESDLFESLEITQEED